MSNVFSAATARAGDSTPEPHASADSDSRKRSLQVVREGIKRKLSDPSVQPRQAVPSTGLSGNRSTKKPGVWTILPSAIEEAKKPEIGGSQSSMKV